MNFLGLFTHTHIHAHATQWHAHNYVWLCICKYRHHWHRKGGGGWQRESGQLGTLRWRFILNSNAAVVASTACLPPYAIFAHPVLPHPQLLYFPSQLPVRPSPTHSDSSIAWTRDKKFFHFKINCVQSRNLIPFIECCNIELVQCRKYCCRYFSTLYIIFFNSQKHVRYWFV